MYNRKDSYYKLAKKEGYKSRAAYKLKEMNKKYNLYGRKSYVLDAGCAPGGWSQVALETVKNGRVVGVDLIEVRGVNDPNFFFIQGDLTQDETVEEIKKYAYAFDCVISDAAPNTAGQRLLDHVNSVELVGIIFELTKKMLKVGGNFCFKLFEGEDRDKLVKSIRPYFDMVKMYVPDATRKSSFEMYIVCKGFKGNNEQSIS